MPRSGVPRNSVVPSDVELTAAAKRTKSNKRKSNTAWLAKHQKQKQQTLLDLPEFDANDVLAGYVANLIKNASKDVHALRKQQNDAATQIQAKVRGHLARQASAGDDAITSLRSSIQGKAEEDATRHLAATTIQAHVRGTQARANVAPVRTAVRTAREDADKAERAATTIQAHVRGHALRTDIRRRIEAHAVRVIALAMRPLLRRARKRIEEKKKVGYMQQYAASKIQAWARGTITRKAYARLYDSRAICICHTLPLHGAPLLTCEDCYETYHPRCLGYRDPGDDLPPEEPPDVPPLEEWDFDPDNPNGPQTQHEHAQLLAQHEAISAAISDFHARPPCPDRSLPWFCPACAAAHLPADEVVFVAAPTGVDANARRVPENAASLSRAGGVGEAVTKLSRPSSAVSNASRVTYVPPGHAAANVSAAAVARPESALSIISVTSATPSLAASTSASHLPHKNPMRESISTRARERLLRASTNLSAARAAEDDSRAAADALLRQYKHGFVAQSDPLIRRNSNVPSGRPMSAAPMYPFSHNLKAPPPPRAAPDGVPVLNLSSIAPSNEAPSAATKASTATKKGATKARRKSVSSASGSDAGGKAKARPKRRMSAVARARVAAARLLPPRPSTAPAGRTDGAARLAANPAWHLDATNVPASALIPQFPAAREELWRRGDVAKSGGSWRAAAAADLHATYQGADVPVSSSLDSPRFRAIHDALAEPSLVR